MDFTITIDGKTVWTKQGKSILESALEAGVYIPHLCKHPDLEAVGGCRLCSVEVNGEGTSVPACMTEAKPGMVVNTMSEAAVETRNTAMELILASHPSECTDCPKYGRCELQSMYQYMGVSAENRKRRHQPVPDDDTNPLILHRFTRCVLCGRCVRACRELRGVKAIDFQRRGGKVRVGTDNGVSLKDAGCRFCGACIEVCPTGSILDQLHLLPANVPYAKAVVPCRAHCPAGIDIPRYLRYIKDGDDASAIAVIREKVPFPYSLGHVCTHLCESYCKRGEINEPVSICRLKRFAAEQDQGEWRTFAWKKERTGKKVAVIGSGPAGLTAAYYLAKLGHEVTVYEQFGKPGGQLRVGIPSYRLPDHILEMDILEIERIGVLILCNTKIEAINRLRQETDAVLIAAGTYQGILLPMAGNDLPEVMASTVFLRSVREGSLTKIGERVIVSGGGDVAFDCARTAIRLGAKDVRVVCLEKRDKMKASQEEIREGVEEGIQIHDACTLIRITGGEHVDGVALKKVSGFSFDGNGKAVIQEVDGSDFSLPADMVIFAVGQKPQTDGFMLQTADNQTLVTDEHFMTSEDGIFAAGDVATGTKSVIHAVAAGRESAMEIDRYLGGEGNIEEILTPTDIDKPVYIGRVERFGYLERETVPRTDVQKRVTCFCDIEQSWDPDKARKEASRCLQCDLRLEIQSPKKWSDF